MPMVLPILSILVITLAVRQIGKSTSLKICPICAGVSGTWLWMLIAIALNFPVDPFIPAILMGGSVVGIAYAAEKRLPAGRSSLLWKSLFIPFGFLTVYETVFFDWTGVAFALAAIGLITFVFFRRPHRHTEQEKETLEKLEEKMEECC